MLFKKKFHLKTAAACRAFIRGGSARLEMVHKRQVLGGSVRIGTLYLGPDYELTYVHLATLTMKARSEYRGVKDFFDIINTIGGDVSRWEPRHRGLCGRCGKELPLSDAAAIESGLHSEPCRRQNYLQLDLGV